MENRTKKKTKKTHPSKKKQKTLSVFFSWRPTGAISGVNERTTAFSFNQEQLISLHPLN